MGGFWDGAGALALAVWLVAPACQSPARNDLRLNEELFRDTDYVAKLPADRAVFVLPVVDARKPPVVDASGPYPVIVVDDAKLRWERSVATMIDDVIRDELRDSRVFADVVETLSPEVCVLRAEVVSFDSVIQELESGGRQYVTVALRVTVDGPKGSAPGGGRRRLLDATYPSRQSERWALRPSDPRTMLGRGLRSSIGAMLEAIDQQNLGRSGLHGR